MSADLPKASWNWSLYTDSEKLLAHEDSEKCESFMGWKKWDGVARIT